MDRCYPIQVKQKDKVGRPDVDAFEGVMTREDRTKGFFVAFDYTSDALREIDAFFRESGKPAVALLRGMDLRRRAGIGGRESRRGCAWVSGRIRRACSGGQGASALACLDS